jgi:hypothetical protein
VLVWPKSFSHPESAFRFAQLRLKQTISVHLSSAELPMVRILINTSLSVRWGGAQLRQNCFNSFVPPVRQTVETVILDVTRAAHLTEVRC